jgi:hypothetical protein
MLRVELFSSGDNTTRGAIYLCININVKLSCYRADVGRGIALLFHDNDTRRFEWT